MLFAIPLEDAFSLNKVCSLIDRELDYIRISYCEHGRIEAIPTFPGIIRGFSRGVVVDMHDFKSRSLNGKVCTNLNQHSLGLFVDVYDEFVEDSLYRVLFSGRNDDVYLRCRSALRRINETYYFTNKDSVFVYLVSTLEFLASDDYISFDRVKPKIIPYLVSTKKQYHSMSDEFREIYKDLRTQVVHCGKSLYDVLPSEKEVDKTINKLVKYIVNYCTAVLIKDIFIDMEILL